MGLDAFVRCRCWEEGLPPVRPVPRGSIVVTEDGLELNLPHEGNEELCYRFDAWVHQGCWHEGMEYAGEHIGNWSSCQQFQWALGVAGWEGVSGASADPAGSQRRQSRACGRGQRPD